MWTAAWTNNTFFIILPFLAAEAYIFADQMQCDTYFKFDVSHRLHSCYRLGVKLAYTHPVSYWSTIFFVPVARVVDTCEYLHSKLGLF